jgi:zinc protease
MGRDNLYVTAVGDFDKREVLDQLEKTFAPWRVAQDKQRDFMARDPVIRPGLFVVEKEISAPAVTLLHQIPVDRTAPLADQAALEILNDILGGSGFRSRLMERLRSDEGLTYGIYSTLFHDGRPGVPGQVSASYETKKVSVARSIASAVEEFQKMARGSVSPAEVQEQIDAWRNRFVFQFTNEFYSAERLMEQELDDRPYDYDRQLLEAVQKVTPADVERVAKKYIKPENLTLCVFGELTDEDRKTLGEKYSLTVLPREKVFRGGYDEPGKPE